MFEFLKILKDFLTSHAMLPSKEYSYKEDGIFGFVPNLLKKGFDYSVNLVAKSYYKDYLELARYLDQEEVQIIILDLLEALGQLSSENQSIYPLTEWFKSILEPICHKNNQLHDNKLDNIALKLNETGVIKLLNKLMDQSFEEQLINHLVAFIYPDFPLAHSLHNQDGNKNNREEKIDEKQNGEDNPAVALKHYLLKKDKDVSISKKLERWMTDLLHLDQEAYEDRLKSLILLIDTMTSVFYRSGKTKEGYLVGFDRKKTNTLIETLLETVFNNHAAFCKLLSILSKLNLADCKNELSCLILNYENHFFTALIKPDEESWLSFSEPQLKELPEAYAQYIIQDRLGLNCETSQIEFKWCLKKDKKQSDLLKAMANHSKKEIADKAIVPNQKHKESLKKILKKCLKIVDGLTSKNNKLIYQKQEQKELKNEEKKLEKSEDSKIAPLFEFLTISLKNKGLFQGIPKIALHCMTGFALGSDRKAFSFKKEYCSYLPLIFMLNHALSSFEALLTSENQKAEVEQYRNQFWTQFYQLADQEIASSKGQQEAKKAQDDELNQDKPLHQQLLTIVSNYLKKLLEVSLLSERFDLSFLDQIYAKNLGGVSKQEEKKKDDDNNIAGEMKEQPDWNLRNAGAPLYLSLILFLFQTSEFAEPIKKEAVRKSLLKEVDVFCDTQGGRSFFLEQLSEFLDYIEDNEYCYSLPKIIKGLVVKVNQTLLLILKRFGLDHEAIGAQYENESIDQKEEEDSEEEEEEFKENRKIKLIASPLGFEGLETIDHNLSFFLSEKPSDILSESFFNDLKEASKKLIEKNDREEKKEENEEKEKNEIECESHLFCQQISDLVKEVSNSDKTLLWLLSKHCYGVLSLGNRLGLLFFEPLLVLFKLAYLSSKQHYHSGFDGLVKDLRSLLCNTISELEFQALYGKIVDFILVLFSSEGGTLNKDRKVALRKKIDEKAKKAGGDCQGKKNALFSVLVTQILQKGLTALDEPSKQKLFQFLEKILKRFFGCKDKNKRNLSYFFRDTFYRLLWRYVGPAMKGKIHAINTKIRQYLPDMMAAKIEVVMNSDMLSKLSDIIFPFLDIVLARSQSEIFSQPFVTSIVYKEKEVPIKINNNEKTSSQEEGGVIHYFVGKHALGKNRLIFSLTLTIIGVILFEIGILPLPVIIMQSYFMVIAFWPVIFFISGFILHWGISFLYSYCYSQPSCRDQNSFEIVLEESPDPPSLLDQNLDRSSIEGRIVNDDDNATENLGLPYPMTRNSGTSQY